MNNNYFFFLTVFVASSLNSNINTVAKRLFRRQTKKCLEYSEFSCGEGHCISRYEVCDGVNHCANGLDETASACRQVSITSCPSKTFRCQYGACIKMHLYCDGKNDCNDFSDEAGCGRNSSQPPKHFGPPHAGAASVCKSSEFQCTVGTCISRYEVCDGKKNCIDGSDETVMACRQVSVTSCPSSAFRCEYGACIKQHMQCDGKSDCSDGSDEVYCGVTSPPPQSYNQSTTSATVSVCNSKGDNQKYTQCANGQCVNQYSMCDGVIDCEDSSDETEAVCFKFFHGQCPMGKWRCKYGACLSWSVRCNRRQDCWDGSDENGCPTGGSTTSMVVPTPAVEIPASQGAILPLDMPSVTRGQGCKVPGPAEGRQFAELNCRSSSCSMAPGQFMAERGLIIVTCEKGHHLLQQNSPFITSCQDGRWLTDIPRCAKVCPKLMSSTLDITCFQGLEQGCDKPMLPKTTIKFKCKEHYETSEKNTLNMIRCNPSGEWSGQLPTCTPKCGQSTLHTSQQATITGGNESKAGNFPWFAGIYHRRQTGWEAACGGTLVKPDIVLTAAHCVTDPSLLTPEAKAKEDIMVALGKYYRNWNTKEVSEARVAIKQVHVHYAYKGAPQEYRDDIAVLVLVAKVAVSTFIMPACMDYKGTYNYQLANDKSLSGYIAGWGNTEECSTHGSVCQSHSLFLQHIHASIKTYDECYHITQTIYPQSQSRLTSDKYCAGDGTLSVVQQGDSGGGQTFVFEGSHFVYGVVSTKLKVDFENRPNYTFSTLTNVSYHMEWLTAYLY